MVSLRYEFITPDYSYLGYQNIAVYLKLMMGTPSDMIHHTVNVDNTGLNCYHTLCYRGNVECLTALLCFERMCLKKVMYDQLQQEKSRYRMKAIDIKHGELVKTVQHAADTIKRHEEFNLRLINLLEQYSVNIVSRLREILAQQDSTTKRNPLHFVAMNKYTKCQKTLEALLDIDFDTVPGWNDYLILNSQLQDLKDVEESFDPRKSHHILDEFKHLISPQEYNAIVRDFKSQIRLLLREVLNQ